MKKILYIIFFATLLYACTEPIDIDVDDSYNRIVIEGQISNDTTAHLIKITRSADFFDGLAPEKISGADVCIRWNSDSVQLHEDSAGYYYTPATFYALENTIYELVIRNVDIDKDGKTEEYNAFDRMTNAIDIDFIKLEKKIQFRGDSVEFVEVQMFAQEPPERNFYIFKTNINGRSVRDSLLEWNLSNDEFFNGNYTNGVAVQQLYLYDSTEVVKADDVVTLELIQISQSYYNFIQSAYFESFGSIPLFSGPPANIIGNISNGGIGYFSAVAISRSSAIYADETP